MYWVKHDYLQKILLKWLAEKVEYSWATMTIPIKTLLITDFTHK